MPLPSSELVLKLCRDAAHRALLAGSLAACARPATGPDSAAPVGEPKPTPITQPAQDQTRAQGATQRAVDEDPRVAPPLRQSDAPSVTSTDELRSFPCGVSHPRLISTDYAWVRASMAAFDRSRFNVPARALHLALDVDYLEIRQATRRPGSGVFLLPAELDLATFASGGTPCATARYRVDCKRELDDKRRQLAASFPCSSDSCRGLGTTVALLTRGDAVSELRSPDQFRALLGTIDTPVEAWLMVMAHRLMPAYQCDAAEYGQHRRIEHGHQLVGRKEVQPCSRDASGQNGLPGIQKEYVYDVDESGNVQLVRERVSAVQEQCAVSGRRPPGLLPFPPPARGAGALLASMAELEHASITAFRRLAHELAMLDVPPALRARARAAARDEVRHTRMLRRLAAAYGGVPRPTRVHPGPARGLLALALDNVSEGCVRELFGAMVAHVQMQKAADPQVAAAFRTIAEDEARHAALALDLHAHLVSRLGADERARVARAGRMAHAALYEALREPSDEERLRCGMPTLRESQQLLLALPVAGSDALTFPDQSAPAA